VARSRKTQDFDEAWDSGRLGRAAEHAQPAAADIEKAIDVSLRLQLISIRLQKSLIEDFKAIASLNGIGYQPLMRQILKRFVDSEKRRINREVAADRRTAATGGKRK
jgi:predicted DNA binding CopG/RHH family protein